MRDLYSTLFYKIKFTVEETNTELDLLWKIVLLIRDWMTNKYNRLSERIPSDIHQWSALKNGGQIKGDRVVLFSEYCLIEQPMQSSFWACKIIETPKMDKDVAPRQWTTEIGVEPIEKNKIVFSCIISYSDRSGFIGESAEIPRPSIPNLIRIIWNDPDLICECGIDKPSVDPRMIKPGEWRSFWEQVKNQERAMPYIYISPLNYPSKEKITLIDPDQLALAMGGNAMVYYAKDPAVTNEMNLICPEEYKCYNGAIRVYYPHIDESNPKDSRKHRFLSARYIEDMGEDRFLQIMRRAIAQDAHFYEDFFRTDVCREMREKIGRQKRLEELKQQHSQELAIKEKELSKEKESIESRALALAVEEEKKRLETEDLADYYAEENQALREENYNLRTENESYITLAKENTDLRKVCDNRLSTKDYPKTPQDIVQYFEATFADMIAFSDDAKDSLKSCTISPDDLWKTFFALATIMNELYINGTGDIYREFQHKSGIHAKRGEGTETRKDSKLMRQYETEYHGEIIDIEAHITYPKIKQSIHFGFSKKDNKLVVGWCGKHKDNYTTQKVH
ncbi:MAG: hypothetical protein IK090_03560 [Clostridia bacterium]|nr:hypothetical protein [Clostridia bacterium]